LYLHHADDDIARLRQERDELLAALINCSGLLGRCVPGFDAASAASVASAVGKAMAAIAKVSAAEVER
jgi:hypothetical protein